MTRRKSSGAADAGMEKPGTVGMFSTPGGVRTIDSPVKNRILAVLRNGELSFDGIVQMSGRAKSTVSVHLKDLIDAGIIGGKIDPSDSRKKIFFIRSPFLGDLSAEQALSLPDEREITAALASGDDPFRFFRLMFRTIRVSLIASGVNIDPILTGAGRKVGEGVYPALEAESMDQFLTKTGRFWQEHSLGRIEVESRSPVTLRVYDCFECGDLPQLGRPACAFDAGILEALFSRFLAADQRVTEQKCFAMGDDHCRFVIEPVDGPARKPAAPGTKKDRD